MDMAFYVLTIKYAVSQEWIDEMNWFFACSYKFRKAKSYFDNYWVGMVRNGQGLLDLETLKSGVSHKWWDEWSRLFEWFLHTVSDGLFFESRLIFHFCWFSGPLVYWKGPYNSAQFVCTSVCLFVALFFGNHTLVSPDTVQQVKHPWVLKSNSTFLGEN